MVADVLKEILPGKTMSGKIVRSVPGRMIFIDVEKDHGVGHEMIALKGDHILVRDDGKVRPYRGEPFAELGLDTGQIVELVRRLEAAKDFIGASNSDFVLVAKKHVTESKHKQKVVLACAATLAAIMGAASLIDKSDILLASLSSLGTTIADVFRSIF